MGRVKRGQRWLWVLTLASLLTPTVAAAPVAAEKATELVTEWGVEKGIAVILGAADPQLPVAIASTSDLLVYVQSADRSATDRARQAADAAGMLGTRVYVEHGDLSRVHLASNLADGAVVTAAVGPSFSQAELMRVLHPGAVARYGELLITKRRPDEADDWSHPYHGPDNNPQTRDRLARAPYWTQFLAEPWYVPMPQVTVASGGRLFKALGHIALKRREWPWLNSLVAINGYNGTMLWKRSLKPGFMVHRNTLIATPSTVYIADDQSCKLLDASSGEVRDEIVVPQEVDVDGVWKWMALEEETLYVLVGQKEKIDTIIRGERKKPGWPWRGLGKGYESEYAWGFGRTLFAMDLKQREINWIYRSEEPIDSRALCLAEGRIYVYSHQKYLASVDASNGQELWRTTDSKLHAAIAEHDRAQTASKGFASSTYVKANDKGVFFAGPQRTRLVAVSAEDGTLMWEYPHGNFQLILREDALYALGRRETSKKFDYRTGEILADLECYRGNCTRATGTADSIFTRGYRHTGTMRLDLSSGAVEARRMPLMRPACQDGVLIAEGLLYWGPWMCDCNHSLVGLISLASADDFEFSQQAISQERLQTFKSTATADTIDEQDWSSYRGDAQRSASSPVNVPARAQQRWVFDRAPAVDPTAPVTAGDLILWGARDGIIRACDAESGKLRWSTYTGGAIRFPPEVTADGVYVGSGDGWIYCLEIATGKTRWRFRAAPIERKILVHGRLLSTWPVGGGILVDEGVVYGAAGIASYDGTHVYALDARTGDIRWQNNTSGSLARSDLVTGVSVQGHLLLHDGKLYLAGGNVVSPAIYDTQDGKCLNTIDNEWLNEPLAEERFPSKPKEEMFRRSPRGRELFLVDGSVRVFDQLLYSPPKYQRPGYFGGHFLQANAGDAVVRGTGGRVIRVASTPDENDKPVAMWEHLDFGYPRALALAANAVLVAGDRKGGEIVGKGGASETGDDAPFLLQALNVEDGTLLWSVPLPARPVSWGLAIDRRGRAIVTLEDGRVLAFGS